MGSPTKLRTRMPESQTPRTIRRRDSLIKSFTEERNNHPSASFHNRRGNKSQGDAPVSVFDEPMTKIPTLRNRASIAENSELTPKRSGRAPSQDHMSITSVQTGANDMPPDGKDKVKSSGYRLSKFPGWRWRERSKKSMDPIEPIDEPLDPVIATSGRSSRQRGRRRLSFHLRKSATAASAEEQAGKEGVGSSQIPTEYAAGDEETPKPSAKTQYNSGGPFGHFATLSRATGRIARADRSQEPPKRPPTAHDQSHAKSRARSLASKIPRARRSDRRQTQRSSRESVGRSTIPSKNPSEHTVASVPPEVQHREDGINPDQEKQAEDSRPSTVMRYDRMTDYPPPATSFREDPRPPTTPSNPTSYYSKTFTGSAVKAMAALFESAAAKDKDPKRPEFLPMRTTMTGDRLSPYTVNPPSPRKSLSSPFETPDRVTGDVRVPGPRQQAEYKGSPHKSSGRGSHDGVDDEDERTTSLARGMRRSFKSLDEQMSQNQIHEPSRDSNGKAAEDGRLMREGDNLLCLAATNSGHKKSNNLLDNEAQFISLPRSPVPRPCSAPTGPPGIGNISRAPMELGTSD